MTFRTDRLWIQAILYLLQWTDAQEHRDYSRINYGDEMHGKEGYGG